MLFSFYSVLILSLVFSVAANRKLRDFVIEQKYDIYSFLDRVKRGDKLVGIDPTAPANASDPCQFLSEEEAPPSARDVFDLKNPTENLVASNIDISVSNGDTISRLTHTVNGVPVWGSGATVIAPPPIRGLCAGPGKLYGASDPVDLGVIGQSLEGNSAQNVAVSIASCMKHWRTDSGDRIDSNQTSRYVYPYSDGRETVADHVIIDGYDTSHSKVFSIACLVDAKTNEIIKSYDNFRWFFGFGGNSKTQKYRYGDSALHSQLPATNTSATNCLMQNPTKTVIVYDLKSTSNRIKPGVTPVVTYNCNNGVDDAINGAFGPLHDCFFNANKVAQFLVDPAWGFSTDMKKYTPTGVFNVGGHFNTRYDNAFWDGTAFYVGDGGNTFLPLCTCIDVVAHEMGHSVTQMTSDLIYSEESGCMNEAFSDMMAEAVEFYYSGANDFKIGASCMKTRPFLRDMSVPMKYDSFTAGTDPHQCSAIFNHAFYKLATSPGWGLQNAWKAFLYANAVFWRKNSVMKQAACDVAVAAGRAKVSGDIKYLVAAFTAVGIDISQCVSRPPEQDTTTRAPTTTPTTTKLTAKTVSVWQPSQTTRVAPTTTTIPSWTFTWPTLISIRSTTPTPGGMTTTTASNSNLRIVRLANCEDLTEISSETGKPLYFKILVPDDATKMNIFMDGLNGDADLYIKAGSVPTLTSWDYRPYWKGSIEWVRSKITQTGWYYIMINASKGYTDLELDACFV